MTRISHGTPGGDAYLDLQNQARRTGRTTDELLRLYVLEGFLARLAASAEGKRLVLKGGVLLAAFGVRRPTRDVDLAALQLNNEANIVRDLIRSIIKTAPLANDGIEFDANSLTTQTIRDEDEYSGVRIGVTAHLASASIGFHVDVNVGDPIWPAPEPVRLPRLRGGSDLELVGYPLHMVHAEKIVTAVQRGIANTRWRDFGDIWVLSRQRPIAGADLRRAIDTVAAHRGTPLGLLVDILDGYAELAQPRWALWRHRSGSRHLPEEFAPLLGDVISFADPVLGGSTGQLTWNPVAGAWQ